GARGDRGDGATPLARARGPDVAPLARPGRGRLLRDLLLRLGHALLSGQAAERAWRPDADSARAAALRVLAGLGAAPAPAGSDRRRRRARRPPAPRAAPASRLRRRALRAR